MDGRVALQDSVVGNDARKAHFSAQGSTYQPDHEGDEDKLHTFAAPEISRSRNKSKLLQLRLCRMPLIGLGWAALVLCISAPTPGKHQSMKQHKGRKLCSV